MGGACTKSNDQQVGNPVSQQDQLVNHEFAPILNVNHPFNVNKKYESVSEIIRDQYTGTGIKKTHAYRTTLTKQELEKKRQEFWDTRTEGHLESWLALKQACTVEESEALAIVAAAGLKLVNRSLQITYDTDGHKYDVPIFCISEPIAYAAVSKYEKFLIQDFENKTIEYKLRVVGIEQNINMSSDNNTKIEDLKEQMQAQIQKKWKKFRLFLAGREMLNHHKLGNYKLDKETIIQAFVSDVE
ncbi:C2 domain protein (macronuclear) [Tetrahymena thermophila SB210]|uniref:C2 domain protein n=1 Tax=Tetrahymena thermophila (strain SB210) TaxID=312017 RepID=W7X292_TETTS|nr:C2 domain protein [Tetrahymena thermophila SB210]EWS73310.1 C2 domain protein [Tetrahymena thermophila SB210]|eukprot:XP_012654159.1 C2 domain protein [Tetrahymena thermophila SB210]